MTWTKKHDEFANACELRPSTSLLLHEGIKNLDRILEILGSKALFVNSWYRPSHVNTRVGGSKRSRHMYGDAVDIRSGHLTPYTVYDLLNREHLQGGLGRYSNFVHIDWRGSKARW